MAFSLDGVLMNVTRTAKNGVVNAETIFEFSQEGDVVEARYSGGGILVGRLIGRVANDKLQFRYVQLTNDGHLDGGASECEFDTLDDGRLRMIERFEWESRDGSGENVFEQIID